MANQLVVELDLESRRFTNGMNRATVRVKQFGDAVERNSRGLRRSNARFGETLNFLRDLSITLFGAIGVFHLLGNAINGLFGSILRASGELERMEVLLRGLAPGDGIKQAAADMQFLFTAAQEAPFSLNALTDSFVKMKTVGLPRIHLH